MSEDAVAFLPFLPFTNTFLSTLFYVERNATVVIAAKVSNNTETLPSEGHLLSPYVTLYREINKCLLLY